ncbi:cell division trigger factor [Bacteroides reticulotermitis JCM 10512]|uniref:Cell division trigger factor n=1 Tax=Bacteroides reticulotermitis JCM 10512 TaxID=1445607 RepID=W4UMA3_9BACE|nr:cell division trigger factor [Bacteroides reticulotermitis JCM 10512]
MNDKVSALLTVKLEKADYQEKVDKSLKSFRQKHKCRDSVQEWFQ